MRVAVYIYVYLYIGIILKRRWKLSDTVKKCECSSSLRILKCAFQVEMLCKN